MKQRTTRVDSSGLEISHTLGRPDRYGDTTLDASGEEGAFVLWMSTATGRDRDNYDSSQNAEIKLNDDEAHELQLALTVWLEQRRAEGEHG